MKLDQGWRGAEPGSVPRQSQALSQDPEYVRWRKVAELTSALGAGVLGVGIGLFFAKLLASYALGFVLVGSFTHGWGMYERHRLDSSGAPSTPEWTKWVYWICWLMMIGLAVYITATLVRE